MTRKELAIEIWKLNRELGIIRTISCGDWVKACLKGAGYLKPASKPELESWYANLLAKKGA